MIYKTGTMIRVTEIKIGLALKVKSQEENRKRKQENSFKTRKI